MGRDQKLFNNPINADPAKHLAGLVIGTLCLRKIMKKIIIILLLIFISQSAHALVEMKILTNEGYVGFTVEDNWTILSMQTKLPIATALFQIPNQADSGTPDSTNLIIKFYQNSSEKAQESFNAPIKKYGEDDIKLAEIEDWKIYSQKAKQEGVVYTIIDAKRDNFAEVSVFIRIAWPHLNGNAKDYNNEMEKRFYNFLKSVNGYIGKYTPKEGEVIRRLEN